MTVAHINRIGTAVPAHDVHAAFLNFMAISLPEGRPRQLFSRMANRSGIAHRYSVLAPEGLVAADAPPGGFYRRGAYPSTATRMQLYEEHAPALAEQAVAALQLKGEAASITHLVVASCTGFVAPGLDQLLAKRLGLRTDLQRSLVGFMGCCAAVPALRIARDAVLADPAARVLVVNLELSTLHLQETDDVQTALSFLLFGDGASAALVTAEPTGFALGDFRAHLIPESEDCITWHIGDQGFIMHLSGQVPGKITQALRADADGLLRGEGTQAIDLWAIHGGGRSVLDAVETGLNLSPDALAISRDILCNHGNMSSATIMFALAAMLRQADGEKRGLAMAFGPGMVAETFRFTRLN
ncbi:MAG: type III polyketide synthase [Acidocella sp. 20-57-95]|nr:MAG: type III polyketide synthase [Acidocella sp. 20-57-95]OYV58600.1 MAG: type III polyketide synthase [Acidocella sp. 21-58-7]HQT65270.1 type III polyketide synthase [Acidocella sp.]HQU05130.1 type III polyketide synthase [Acidocella sp.]